MMFIVMFIIHFCFHNMLIDLFSSACACLLFSRSLALSLSRSLSLASLSPPPERRSTWCLKTVTTLDPWAKHQQGGDGERRGGVWEGEAGKAGGRLEWACTPECMKAHQSLGLTLTIFTLPEARSTRISVCVCVCVCILYRISVCGGCVGVCTLPGYRF